MWQVGESSLLYQQETNISSSWKCTYLGAHVLAYYFLVLYCKNLDRTHPMQTTQVPALLIFSFNSKNIY